MFEQQSNTYSLFLSIFSLSVCICKIKNSLKNDVLCMSLCGFSFSLAAHKTNVLFDFSVIFVQIKF